MSSSAADFGSLDYSSEIEDVPLWVAERPLLPGFQERASVEVANWWYSHDAPQQVARVAANSSIGTLLRVISVPDTLGGDEPAVVLQSHMRIKVRGPTPCLTALTPPAHVAPTPVFRRRLPSVLSARVAVCSLRPPLICPPAFCRGQVLRSRTHDGLQYADVQLMPDSEEVTQHVDLAVHALSSLPSAGSWLHSADAESVVRSVAHAAAAMTARAWAGYECSSRIGTFKFGSTELMRMNRTIDTIALAAEAHALAIGAAEQASRLENMRYAQPTDAPAGWLADGPAPGGEGAAGSLEGGGASSGSQAAPPSEASVHVVLAAQAAARYLASRVVVEGAAAEGTERTEPARGSAQAASLKQSLQQAEWDLWLSIDAVWFLLSKLSSKRSLLLPDQVLQLQPPPPPGGWAHQYCMQQGSPAVATGEWSFDEAYPLPRRAQRLSFVASSLMPGAPQQQILEVDSVAERLRFLRSVFERHEMALRSLVALQEIETDGTLSSGSLLDDDPAP